MNAGQPEFGSGHPWRRVHFACSGIVSYSVQANFFESGAQPPVLPEPCPPKKVLTVVNSAPFAPTPFSRRSSLIFMPSPMYVVVRVIHRVGDGVEPLAIRRDVRKPVLRVRSVGDLLGQLVVRPCAVSRHAPTHPTCLSGWSRSTPTCHRPSTRGHHPVLCLWSSAIRRFRPRRSGRCRRCLR